MLNQSFVSGCGAQTGSCYHFRSSLNLPVTGVSLTSHHDAGARGGITAFSREELGWAYTRDLLHREQLRRCRVSKKSDDLLRSSRWRHWDDESDASSCESRGVPRPHRALARSFWCAINGTNFGTLLCPSHCARNAAESHMGQAPIPYVGSGTGLPRRGSAP